MADRPILFSGPMVRAILAGTKTQTRRVIRNPERFEGIRNCGFCCPIGQPGDTLWVRETWQEMVANVPLADGSGATWDGKSMRVVYRADGDHLASSWRSPTHMPRWASRLSLRVKSVRVERLQEISEADARAEGITCTSLHRWGLNETGMEHNAPTHAFRALWDSLNAKRHPWASNPWVWVCEFERIEKEEPRG